MKINIRNISSENKKVRLVPKSTLSEVKLLNKPNGSIVNENGLFTFCLTYPPNGWIPTPDSEGYIPWVGDSAVSGDNNQGDPGSEPGGETEIPDITAIDYIPPYGRLTAADMSGEGWSLITFDDLGSVNPTYTRDNPLLGEVIVTTGAFFKGQSVTPLNNAFSIYGIPTPNTSLALAESSTYTAVVKSDTSSPMSPVLSGNINYDSPVSVLFSKDVHAVGLTGGYFNNERSTYIEVYDRLGSVIGYAVNTRYGMETFGFSSGSEAKIAGFSFYINSQELQGFALDNLKFK